MLGLWVIRGGKGGRTVGDKLILEADIKGGVRVGGECHSCLAREVFGLAVFVADRIFDLYPHV